MTIIIAAIDFASSSSITLTTDQLNANKIKFTDTGNHLTGRTSIIAALTNGATRVVHNGTSKALYWVGSTGYGVQIPAGDVVSVACDGTNWHFANPQGKSVINVQDFGVYGRTNQQLFGSEGDATSSIKAALTLAQTKARNGQPSILYFPAQDTDSTVLGHVLYSTTSPLRINQGNVTIQGDGRASTIIRSRCLGPTMIVGPTITPPLVTQLVPPASSNPAGQAWDLDGNPSQHPLLNFTDSSVGTIHGLSAMTIEFFLRIDTTVATGQSFTIMASSGELSSEDHPVHATTAFSIGVSSIFSSNQLHVVLCTSAVPLTSVFAGNLTTGTTYHVAVSYGSGTLNVLASNIASGTGVVVHTQSLAGTIKQEEFEAFKLGCLPGSAFGSDKIENTGAGTVDAIRISNIDRYTAGGFTVPTTKWSTVLSDPNSLFILNFDNTIETDVIGGYGPSTLPCYLPVYGGDVGTTLITDVNIKDIAFEGGLTNGGGLFCQIAIATRIENVNATGWYGLQLNNNCFLTTVEKCNFRAIGTHCFAFADIGAGNDNRFTSIQTEGGYCGVVLIGGAPRQINDIYTVGWGAGYGLVLDETICTGDSLAISAEGRTSPCLGSISISGFQSIVHMRGSSFDGTWVQYPPFVFRGSNPVHITSTSQIKFDSCLFASGDGTTEIIYCRSAPDVPVVVDNCFFENLYNAPLSLTPQYVVNRDGSSYEQSKGYKSWLYQGASATNSTKKSIGIVRTTGATKKYAIFSGTVDALGNPQDGIRIPLIDLATTLVSVSVVAKGPSWSWTQSSNQMFNSASGVVTKSIGASTRDSIGTVPGAIASSIEIIAPPAAATAALIAADGVVDAGTHLYCYTWVSPDGESAGSIASNSVTTVPVGHGQVGLTGILAGASLTTSRKVYRTRAGTTSPFFLIGTIANNSTTTFTDNATDYSLASPFAAPALSTIQVGCTGDAATVIDWSVVVTTQQIH